MVSDGSWVVRVQAAKLLVCLFVLFCFVCLIHSSARMFLRALNICSVIRLSSSGLHEAGEPTLPRADTGQEADVRPQGMETFVLTCRHVVFPSCNDNYL